MIEIGSWIGLAAMTKSEITIKNVVWNQLGIIPDVFRKLGIILEQRGEDIYIPSQDHYKIQKFIDGSILTVADAPWPGFTPDFAIHYFSGSYSSQRNGTYPSENV
jgi:UDP-N-acetylglucosamine 1-carboxyvinyltransferase